MYANYLDQASLNGRRTLCQKKATVRRKRAFAGATEP